MREYHYGNLEMDSFVTSYHKVDSKRKLSGPHHKKYSATKTRF